MNFILIFKLKFINKIKSGLSLFSIYKFTHFLIDSFFQFLSVLFFFIELNLINIFKYLIKLIYFITFLFWFRLLALAYNLVMFKRRHYIIMYRFVKFLIVTNKTLFFYRWFSYFKIITQIFIYYLLMISFIIFYFIFLVFKVSYIFYIFSSLISYIYLFIYLFVNVLVQSIKLINYNYLKIKYNLFIYFYYVKYYNFYISYNNPFHSYHQFYETYLFKFLNLTSYYKYYKFFNFFFSILMIIFSFSIQLSFFFIYSIFIFLIQKKYLSTNLNVLNHYVSHKKYLKQKNKKTRIVIFINYLLNKSNLNVKQKYLYLKYITKIINFSKKFKFKKKITSKYNNTVLIFLYKCEFLYRDITLLFFNLKQYIKENGTLHYLILLIIKFIFKLKVIFNILSYFLISPIIILFYPLCFIYYIILLCFYNVQIRYISMYLLVNFINSIELFIVSIWLYIKYIIKYMTTINNRIRFNPLDKTIIPIRLPIKIRTIVLIFMGSLIGIIVLSNGLNLIRLLMVVIYFIMYLIYNQIDTINNSILLMKLNLNVIDIHLNYQILFLIEYLYGLFISSYYKIIQSYFLSNQADLNYIYHLYFPLRINTINDYYIPFYKKILLIHHKKNYLKVYRRLWRIKIELTNYLPNSLISYFYFIKYKFYYNIKNSIYYDSYYQYYNPYLYLLKKNILKLIRKYTTYRRGSRELSINWFLILLSLTIFSVLVYSNFINNSYLSSYITNNNVRLFLSDFTDTDNDIMHYEPFESYIEEFKTTFFSYTVQGLPEVDITTETFTFEELEFNDEYIKEELKINSNFELYMTHLNLTELQNIKLD